MNHEALIVHPQQTCSIDIRTTIPPTLLARTLCFCDESNWLAVPKMVVLCGTAYVALVSDVFTSADWLKPKAARGASLATPPAKAST